MTVFPRISVVIPAYNAGATIARACESVLAQSYPNTELIVVNDGSKDSTAAVLDALAAQHSCITVLHQENGGVCRARNAGKKAARGDYLFFLDADDELMPDCLQRLYSTAAEADCAIVAGPCVEIKPDGTQTPYPYDIPEPYALWEGDQGLQQSLRDHPATYSVWGKLYRRDVVENVWFVEGKRIHEDSFFLFQTLLGEKRMAVTNHFSVRYHVTRNSASRANFSDRFLDILYFADRKLQIVEECYPQYLPLAKNMLVKANMAWLKALAFSRDDGTFRNTERKCLALVRRNAAWFVPAIRMDRILFLFIRLRLFWLFKWLYRLLRR